MVIEVLEQEAEAGIAQIPISAPTIATAVTKFPIFRFIPLTSLRALGFAVDAAPTSTIMLHT
ncbi:MAG: hypothetical protein M3067_08390 [Chloroflexota bacterium]|nr:hypothetical protein [Chloroflexota bacterium]